MTWDMHGTIPPETQEADVMTKTDTKAPERTDAYLIEKRGLYYRPESAGYTGLKDEAGRYTLERVAVHFPNRDSPNQDGMTYIHEDEAPEYSSACAWDVRLVHKARKEAQDEARATIDAQAKVIEAARLLHAKCIAAWAAGEPREKVKSMLDAADAFDAELAVLQENSHD